MDASSNIFWDPVNLWLYAHRKNGVYQEVAQLDVMKTLQKSGRSDLRSCVMRQYLDRPSAELLARGTGLAKAVEDLAPRDVLISLHLRFGDTAIRASVQADQPGATSSRRYKKDDRGLNAKVMANIQQVVTDLISALEKRDPSLRVRLFVASDVPQGIAWVREHWGSRLVPLREKVAFHSRLVGSLSEEKKRSLVSDLASDWFLLAIADVLIQPMSSSLSDTAAEVGIHRCSFRGNQLQKPIMAPVKAKCVQDIVQTM